MKKRISAFLLCLLMIVFLFPISSFAENTLQFSGIKSISKYGNIKFNSTIAEVLAEFDYGDILTVTFGESSIDLPLVKNFSDVDSGKPGFFVRYDGEDEVMLAINSGNFAQDYGIAQKTVNQDKSYYWTYSEDFSENTTFTFVLKEKAGYLEEFTLRNVSYTDSRDDYENLSDAEFANFRNVSLGRIKKSVLYRSATPVEPIHNRNSFADKCSETAGITYFINLGDNEETLIGYADYISTYYATQNHIAVAANVDYTSSENQKAFCDAFRYMSQHQGIYDVHCREGKDRTGIFVAVLECLMGATFEEICDDYMITYYNYYGITENDSTYNIILNGSFIKTMNKIFETDISNANLKKEAKEYLLEIGLTKAEISSLKINLTDNIIEKLILNLYVLFLNICNL